MNVLDAAAFDLQRAFDDGMIGGRAFGEAAVQFDMFGARHRRLHRSAVDAIDRGIVEHDRGPLRNWRAGQDARARRCCQFTGIAGDVRCDSEIVAGPLNSAISSFGS